MTGGASDVGVGLQHPLFEAGSCLREFYATRVLSWEMVLCDVQH